jgi:hypothetical protein
MEGVLAFFHYHQYRGMQIESIAAGIIGILQAFRISDSGIQYNYGAWHVTSPLADVLLKVLPIFLFLALGMAAMHCLLAFRKEYRSEGAISLHSIVTHLVIVLLTLVVFNKVFSPQYILWLLPFVALLSRTRAYTLLLISVLTALLTTRWIYEPLIEQQLFAMVLLNLRNLLVVLLFLWQVADKDLKARIV